MSYISFKMPKTAVKDLDLPSAKNYNVANTCKIGTLVVDMRQASKHVWTRRGFTIIA